MSLACTESVLCLSGGLVKLGFMANILKGEEWEVNIDYPERLSKQEKEKGWSGEMCQSCFTTRLNPSYFSSPRERLR